MSIALGKAIDRCIRGSRIPANHMSNRFRREGGARVGLLKRAIISSRLQWSKIFEDTNRVRSNIDLVEREIQAHYPLT